MIKQSHSKKRCIESPIIPARSIEASFFGEVANEVVVDGEEGDRDDDLPDEPTAHKVTTAFDDRVQKFDNSSQTHGSKCFDEYNINILACLLDVFYLKLAGGPTKKVH